MYNYYDYTRGMIFLLNKAFNIICDKVEETLSQQGFTKAKANSTDSNEMVALFVSENVAYSVIYYKDKQHFVMRTSAMTDDGPDNDWKTLATWMFDPNTDTEREASSIGNDFCDVVSAPVAVKRMKQQTKKKKKSEDEGNNPPVFLANRLVTLFPELKDEIKFEEDGYYPFRGATFTKEHIVPKVNALVTRGNENDIQKLVSILNAQYLNGDMDTRSIITIVILNSIDDDKVDVLKGFMSDDLKKASECARKFKGKTVKPEKVKKQKQTMAQRLGGK